VTSVVDGTRFERAAATRRSIIDAAADLFGSRGYRFVSLRDIAAQAGISHPALLKHFAGKEELLSEVERRYDRPNDAANSAADALPFSSEARREASVPGYGPFFAALTGEASASSHPLHVVMGDRLHRLRDNHRRFLEEGRDRGLVAPDRDLGDESTRLIAAWNGLRMLQRYLPDRVDIARTLETHERLLAHPVSWRPPGDRQPDPAPPPAPPSLPLSDDPGAASAIGYRIGRQRRAEIVDGATTLFAREGYGDTSLLDIAKRVGVSKSALYHHFVSKDALLHEVLRDRDRRIDESLAGAATATATDVLRSLPDGAAANESGQPGLIELYAVISSEATPVGHDAHAYFEHRFRQALSGFGELFQAAADAGSLPSHREPEHEALWLLALWDGLQYAWLYEHAGVDVAGQLREHLADVLAA
jgi:AcrR family transcriptional regulator